MHKQIQLLLILGITLCSCVGIFGQKAWERPMKDWKTEDALKIMTNSPWAYSHSDENIQWWTRNSNEKSTVSALSPEIVLRLYSANIVRQAIMRLNQINAKYDQLDDKGKAAVDERNRKLAECDLCKNYYIVVMMQPTTNNAPRNFVGERLKDLTLEKLKGSIYLTNELEEKRELVQFVAPQTEAGFAIFYFERLDATQKPLLSPTSKKLNFIWRVQRVDDRAAPLMQSKVEFNVSKMIVNSAVDF